MSDKSENIDFLNFDESPPSEPQPDAERVENDIVQPGPGAPRAEIFVLMDSDLDSPPSERAPGEENTVQPGPGAPSAQSSQSITLHAHSIQRREAEPDYDDTFVNDAEANGDDGAQNDADGGNDSDDDDEVEGTIMTEPTTYTPNRGSSLRLECNVEPKQKDNIVVQWRKDGEALFLGNSKISSSNRISIFSDTKDLLITELEPSDSGKYECSIAQTKPVRVEHTVLVQEAPRIIRFMASGNGRVTEGSDLLLTCDVTGYPKPEIGWSRLFNGGNVKLSERDGEFSSNTFLARNVKKEMTGTYFCFAMNKVSKTVASLNVTILSKPHVHVHKTVINTDLRIQAELSCSAHEQPTPHFRWYKDGQLIEDSSMKYNININGPKSTLTVTPRVDTDFGTFTCEAMNEYGKHNRSIDLVQNPVIDGFDVDGPKISWTVHSHQPLENIEIQLRNLSGDGKWSRIKLPVPETKQNKHEYEVIYVVEDTELSAGKFEAVIKAKNSKGWSPHTEPAVIDIESQAQPIQTASVFRDSGSGASAFRPTAILATICMYHLLVRTF